MFSLSLYRHAMRLYPALHREQFGEEMISVFRELRAETATEGMLARSRFCAREIAGVVAGALREHWRTLGGDHVGAYVQTGGLPCGPNSVFRRPLLY